MLGQMVPRGPKTPKRLNGNHPADAPRDRQSHRRDAANSSTAMVRRYVQIHTLGGTALTATDSPFAMV